MHVRILFTIVFLSSQVLLLPDAEAKNCKEPSNQLEANECAKDALDSEDRALNASYSAARSRLDEKEQIKLKNAQLTWIKFRDQFCEVAGSFYEGGSLVGLTISNCKRDLTIHQRKNLDSLRP